MTCSGVFPAIITPFDQKGHLDQEGFCLHVQRQKDAGVHGLTLLGSTGEGATLTHHEKQTLIKITRKYAPTMPLIIGCGSNATAATIENIDMAAQCGGDYALVVAPYYNRPTQEGLFKHFEAISKNSPLPILLYNNPERAGVNIELETMKRIADLPRIVGVKESSGNIDQISDVIGTLKKQRPEFSVLCGDDKLAFATMALGADGVISGGSNLFPEQMIALVKACQREEFQKARELHFFLTPVFKALAMESNPIPLKAALQLLNLPAGDPRLPLTPLNSNFLPKLKQAIEWLNAIPTF